jgi:tripartite-type tricarboxylate transporter receptor subunit TctC
MYTIKRRDFIILVAGAAMILPAAADAVEAFPNRPIRLVVPYPPGGGTDIVGRVLGEKLGASLGQPIVVDNRGGAGGILGTEIVAKAAPDGYTLLLVPTSHVINPSIYAKLPPGRCAALAITSARRSVTMPEIPTTAEAGFPELIADNSYALFAPAKTPASILTRLHDAAAAALALPEVRDRLREQGAEVVGGSSTELAAYVAAEIPKWAALARQAGVKPE